MKNTMQLLALLLMLGILPMRAQVDYTAYLTTDRGFTEVTTTSGLLSGDYYYVIGAAEDTGLIVGAGDYAAKPGWASEMSKALRYKTVTSDPVADRTNLFTIEQCDEYYALFSIVYSADAFQTHENASYMYVNTFTCQGENVKEWGGLKAVWNNGYWTFEEGKYSGNFLGPWNKSVADGEAIAGNRANTAGDEAGHYRLFRIAKSDYETFYQNMKHEALLSASSSNPVDATFLITNPSFETGDTSGWTPTGDANNTEIGAKGSVTSNGEGGYTFNAFQWWSGLSISQTAYVPSGIYDISAVVAAWEIDDVTFSAGTSSVTKTGQGDMVGIPVSFENIKVGTDNSLTLSASSNADWWSDGRSAETNWQYACGFFKLDNVQLVCKGLYLMGIALPLPNDETTVLTAGQWYYYDAPVAGKYQLTGNLLGMVYSDETDVPLADIATHPTKQEMGFDAGYVFFKTTRSDATLKVEPANEVETFTAIALNVDGMPETVKATVAGITVKTIELNSDGPMADGSRLISQYLAGKGFDFIACSEDFNFHTQLMSSLSNYSSGTLRATIPSSVEVLSSGTSPTFDTDGLNLIWKNNLSTAGESWTQFNAMTSTDGNQYIKKGYRYYEVTLASGDKLDVFITHMDAGDEAATGSRPQQLKQIANAILSKGHTDRPKIFMGDTNCRWTREDLKTNFFDILSGTYDVSDVWVELCHNNEYPSPGQNTINEEVVDKIIYINPKGNNVMKLGPISYVRDAANYVKSDGTPLGDHAPVIVQFGLGLYEEVDNTLIIGDVNRDKQISIADVTALVNIILGKDATQPYKYDHVAADVNQDEQISIADVTALVNIILGK